jgi:hypothetical protein
MREKLYYFLATFLSVLILSCSDDNLRTHNYPNQPVDDRYILPQNVTYKMLKDDYDDYGYRIGNSYHYQVNTFTYKANKIETITCNYLMDGTNKNYMIKVIFAYEGNLITKAESYLSDKLLGTTFYSYENNKLKQQVLMWSKNNTKFNTKIVYSYNDNGTVSYDKFWFDGEKAHTEKALLTIINGNIIKKVLIRDTSSEIIYDYKYDNEDNPFKNVLGLNLIAFGDLTIGVDPDMLHEDFGISEFGTNNVIEKKTTVKYDDEIISINKEIYDLEFNIDGFPKKKHFNNKELDQLFFVY